MKIGIFTHHWVPNFGANLQALAVQSAFRSRGCETVFINYRGASKKREFERRLHAAQLRTHDEFVRKHLTQSQELEDWNDVRTFCDSELDAIVVGSDAMFSLVPKYYPGRVTNWLKGRPTNYDRALPPFWLAWPKLEEGPKRYSLSVSSMGTFYRLMDKDVLRRARTSLASFDAIYVRDAWTDSMLRWISPEAEEKMNHSPDPVFSMPLNGMASAAKPSRSVDDAILLCGIDSESWCSAFANAARRKGYRVGSFCVPEKDLEAGWADFSVRLPLDPIDWYSTLSGCAGYVGIRFHALVSCITNQTPVVTVDEHRRAEFVKQSSKQFDLCKRAGIGDRYYTHSSIVREKPERILETLMSNNSASTKYATNAMAQFAAAVDQICLDCGAD